MPMKATKAMPMKAMKVRNRKPRRRSGKAGGSDAMKAMKAAMKKPGNKDDQKAKAMKAMKAAMKKPGDKDDQKAKAMKAMKTMKAMKKPMKAMKKPMKAMKTVKAASGTQISKVMQALEKLQINNDLKNVVRASLKAGGVKNVPDADGEWVKIVTQNVTEVLLNLWNEGKAIKYKWYLCFKK